jgi:hypothetical protein
MLVREELVDRHSEEVKAALVAFLEGSGWEIKGDDNLKGFSATYHFPQ